MNFWWVLKKSPRNYQLHEFLSSEWTLHECCESSERILRESRRTSKLVLNGFWVCSAWVLNEIYMCSEWILNRFCMRGASSLTELRTSPAWILDDICLELWIRFVTFLRHEFFLRELTVTLWWWCMGTKLSCENASKRCWIHSSSVQVVPIHLASSNRSNSACEF